MCMQNKKIIYTDHANIRKFERDLSDAEISETINTPDYVIVSVDDRKTATKKIKNRTINVVYKDKIKNIIVITVY